MVFPDTQPFVNIAWAEAVNPESAFFVWQMASMPDDPNDLITVLLQNGIRRVTIKVLDGTRKYNVPEGDRPLMEYFDALRAAGIKVEAWGYHYPDAPGPQGDAIEERRQKLGFSVYHVNCEKEWKAAYGMPAAMKTLLGKLKIGGFTVTMCSYRYPSSHTAFPWDTAMNHEGINAATPQVYFALAHNPEAQLKQTFDEYARWGKPVHPVGPAFGATFGGVYWEPTPEELTRFRVWCVGKTPVIYWWSLDWILNKKRFDLLEAATGYSPVLPPPPVEPPAPELPLPYMPWKQVRITAANVLNIRAQPNAGAHDLGDLKRDSVVPVYREFGDWYDTGGGWIHKGYTRDV